MIYFDPKKLTLDVTNSAIGDLIELKAAHDQAVISGESEFSSLGHVWHVGYAKYVIEYLEDRFKQ
tara:strand:+ start:2317 stop:2511 length:195 start_codon:yes stop_codon:yes gene_type:complete